MSNTPSTTATFIKSGLSAAVVFGALAAPATADYVYDERPQPRYAANDTDFRRDHPMRVFVKFAEDRRGSKEARRNAPQTMHRLGYHLPNYVQMVNSPERADLVIRVRETDYNLNFRVIDIDHKDKKYKKDRRYGQGRCGVHHKAYYTKVKEKGEAYASYNLKVNLKGIGRDQDHFTLRSAENYSYGRDLRASTNCGTRPTHQMPSNGVAKLFSRSNEGYRHQVASKIRNEAAGNLSRKLAHQIREQADYYYTDLAARMTYGHHAPKDEDILKRELYGLLFDLLREHPQPSGG